MPEHARLEDWSVHWCFEAFTKQRALVPAHLLGKVYGHSKHPDGTLIVTEPLVMFDGEACLAQDTLDTFDLGRPHPNLDKGLARYNRTIGQVRYQQGLRAA